MYYTLLVFPFSFLSPLPTGEGLGERLFSDCPDFPASGARERTSGELIVVGANGHSWGSSPYGRGLVNGGNLNFHAGIVNPTNNNNRGYGLQVRCVQESIRLAATH